MSRRRNFPWAPLPTKSNRTLETAPMPELIDVAEALLFASETPVEADRIQEVLRLDSAGEARELVRELVARLDARGSALQVIEVGGGYPLLPRPEAGPGLGKAPP